MANIQLLDFRNSRDGSNIFDSEPVPGVNGEPDRGSVLRRFFERGDAARIGRCVRVLSCVKLDRGRSNFFRAVDDLEGGTNEQADSRARRVQAGDPFSQPVAFTKDVQPTLRGDLLAALRNEGDLVGPNLLGDRDHFVGARHLEIEDGRHRCGEAAYVVVLNVPTILSKVRRDAIRSSALAEHGALDRVGFIAPPRLANGRDVVDVDVEALPLHVTDLEVSRKKRDGVVGFTFDEEARVKKLITAAVVLCACSSSSTVTKTAPSPAAAPVVSGNQTGAADPVLAIRGFLAAAKAQDIQALGALWGDAQGPARDRMERTEAEKRELIMACYLKHDRYDIVGDAPNPGGTRAVVVSLTLGNQTRSANFEVVQGPGRRWYVQNVDLKSLQDFCARR